MPGKSTNLGVAAFAVFIAVFSGVLLVKPQTAQADPHAVFYTAIGQRQFFFNTLAALDQADYVEPATADAGVESREALEKQRTTAGLAPESNAVVQLPF